MFSLLIQKKTTFKFKTLNQLYLKKKKQLLTNLNQLKKKNY